MDKDQILQWNRGAWDREVAQGNEWTRPFGPERIAEARGGRVRVLLTPTREVPAAWLGPLAGARVLCLACGGGQQAPLFAAAGAQVTVLDNSPAQLAQDRLVAEREGLRLRLEQGDMAELGRFADASFDLVFNPCSTAFVPAVRPIWRECARVLRVGGALLTGFTNPWAFLFDPGRREEGALEVAFPLPYRDLDHRDHPSVRGFFERGQPLEWSHTLEDQLAGQTEAGLAIVGLFEDRYDPAQDVLSRYVAPFVATRAIRLRPSDHAASPTSG